MDVAHARRLLAYDTWATTRLLDASGLLAEDGWTREVGGSFPSVAATLAHVAGAKWVWLQRLSGTSHPIPDWTKGASLADLRERFAEIDRGWDTHVAGLADADLGRTLAYRNLAGEPYERRIEDILTHLVNHGTYHRGQATTQLRQLGVKPPPTDFIYFVQG